MRTRKAFLLVVAALFLCLPLFAREYIVQIDTVAVKQRPTALSGNVGTLNQGQTVNCEINDLGDVEGGFVQVSWNGGSGFVRPGVLGTELRSGDIGTSDVDVSEATATAAAKGFNSTVEAELRRNSDEDVRRAYRMVDDILARTEDILARTDFGGFVNQGDLIMPEVD